jgi:hypothetical protein
MVFRLAIGILIAVALVVLVVVGVRRTRRR